jgi:hypothetical protein
MDSGGANGTLNLPQRKEAGQRNKPLEWKSQETNRAKIHLKSRASGGWKS